ncbi:mid1-interacting protein 1-B-like [Sphaerodactylus townsendi]|uniref:mid1-interacting protein 1-B-like n=1 Tax=Sphaerodactylus townsendi TaxID=933632 RepID=UPI0020273F43|nr:mid1-interacting protein 1-B-like [Sphaerodactylus townsendi]
MEEYFSAVSKMEQTVMFPSLLRGISLDKLDDPTEADSGSKDLYEYFMQLKSIKGMVEGGLAPLEGRDPSIAVRLREQEDREKADLEGFFYYHVSNLYRILNQLTRRADAVTTKYNEIMCQINRN